MFNKILSLFNTDEKRNKELLLMGALKEVEIEGAKFYLRRLPAAYIVDLKDRNAEKAIGEAEFFEMLSMSVCNRKGKPMLTKEEARDLNFVALNTLIIEMLAYNNLNADAVEVARKKLKNLKTQSE